MKPSTLTLILAGVINASAGHSHSASHGRLETRGGRTSWAGVNHYYLASLPHEEMLNTVQTLKDNHVPVVRTFLRAQAGACEKNDLVEKHGDVEIGTGGSLDLTVMDRYDRMLVACKNAGIQVILALHNGNNFGHSACDSYCVKAGGPASGFNIPTSPIHTVYGQKFYTDEGIIGEFDKRLQAVLKYKSTYPGGLNEVWGDSDTILAVDIENEPLLQATDLNVGDPWICDRAKAIKKVAPRKLVSTGGIGGSNGDSSEHVNMPEYLAGDKCPEVDILALHVYDNKFLVEDLNLYGNDVSKLVFIEEWTATTSDPTKKTGLIQSNSYAMNARGIPWLYWSVHNNVATNSECPPEPVEVAFSDGDFTALAASIDAARRYFITPQQRWNDYVWWNRRE